MNGWGELITNGKYCDVWALDGWFEPKTKVFGKRSEYEVSEDDGRYGADGELFAKGSEYDVWEVDGRIEIGEVFGNGTEYD